MKTTEKSDNDLPKTTEQSYNKQEELLDIRMQMKIFSYLLMMFAVLLLFAMVSYTERDNANIQFRVSDLFSIFSNDSEIRYKVDTTLNFLGLFGAYISDLLINKTVGFWILPLPIFLFFWGFQMNKLGMVSNKMVLATSKYLIIAILLSSIMGSLSNFTFFQYLSIYFYGVIGAFIGSVVSSAISPIGSTLLFVAILIVLLAKYTNIKRYGIINSLKKLKDKININSIIDRINSIVSSLDSREPIKKQEANTIYPDDYQESPMIENSENTNGNEPIDNKEVDITDNLITNFTGEITPSYPYKEPTPLKNEVLDNVAVLKNFKGAVKLKINNAPLAVTEEIKDDNGYEEDRLEDKPIVIYEPPQDIILPQSPVYVPEITNVDDVEYEEKAHIEPNQPITIDFIKPSIKPITSAILSTYEEDNCQKLRNPLGVSIHEKTIKYTPPILELLDVGQKLNYADDNELQRKGAILQDKLQTFNINISNLEATRGPVVTQYEFIPADGVKVSKIEGLSDDLAMALKAQSVHIIAPVPGKGTVGIQVPNSKPSIVSFHSVASSADFIQSKMELPLALGKTVSGQPYVADLAKMPHLLIAGSTGSGKSVGINTIITSLLYKKHPSQLKFVIIDPKKVELTPYTQLSSHFLAVSPDLNAEIVTNPQDAIIVMKAAVAEMEKRYSILEMAKQRNIKDYNQKVREGAYKNDPIFDHRELPYIVVVVDELADLMLTVGKDIETSIVRLAQMARAIGIHIIIATQRPSVKIITGILKANFPARIAYLVAQNIDSRTILDASGAERLLGNGDMLFNPANQPNPIRIQNPFISTDEVERICDFIGNQEGYSLPYMLPSVSETKEEGSYEISTFDPLFREAAELIITSQQASTSMLQRRMKIGFARAGRIIDELAAAKVIGPPQGSKPRAILMDSISELESIM